MPGNPCSSGNADPNDDVGAVLWLGTTALSAFLASRGLGWLSTLTGAVGDLAIDPDSFCQSGQPALPTITAADVLALLNPFTNVNAGPAAIKLRDLILYYLWYEVCHCVGGSTTAATEPQDPVAITGGPTDTDPTACLVSLASDDPWTETSGGIGFEMGDLFWGSGESTTPPYSDPTKTVLKAHLFGHKEFASTGTHEDPWTIRFRWTSLAALTVIRETDYLISGPAFDITELAPAGAQECRPVFLVNTDNEDDRVVANLEGFCSGQPGQDRLGCCPPDPNIASSIAALNAALALVKEQVDLIQRQGVPFAYVPGTFHTGLTGAGVVTFSEPTIGVKIIISSLPADISVEFGDESQYFTDSWVNFSSGGDRGLAYRIQQTDQLIFPPAAGVFDQLSYSLRPGLTIAVLELYREA